MDFLQGESLFAEIRREFKLYPNSRVRLLKGGGWMLTTLKSLVVENNRHVFKREYSKIVTCLKGRVSSQVEIRALNPPGVIRYTLRPSLPTTENVGISMREDLVAIVEVISWMSGYAQR